MCQERKRRWNCLKTCTCPSFFSLPLIPACILRQSLQYRMRMPVLNQYSNQKVPAAEILYRKCKCAFCSQPVNFESCACCRILSTYFDATFLPKCHLSKWRIFLFFLIGFKERNALSIENYKLLVQRVMGIFHLNDSRIVAVYWQ